MSETRGLFAKKISLNQFQPVVGMRPGKDRDHLWENFLIDLENFLNSLQPGPTATAAPVRPSGSGSTTTGGFSGGSPIASSPQDIAISRLKVAYSPSVPLLVGSLVHYAAGNVQLADCRDVNKWANFVVLSLPASGFAEITCSGVASLPLRIKAGRGTNSIGSLYLYQNGTCTDEESDIMDLNTGLPVDGAQISQVVGATQRGQGPVPAGAVRGNFAIGATAVIV